MMDGILAALLGAVLVSIWSEWALTRKRMNELEKKVVQMCQFLKDKFQYQ